MRTPQVQATASPTSRDRTPVQHVWSNCPCSTTHPSPNLITRAPLGAARANRSGRPITAKDDGELFPGESRKLSQLYASRGVERRSARLTHEDRDVARR